MRDFTDNNKIIFFILLYKDGEAEKMEWRFVGVEYVLEKRLVWMIEIMGRGVYAPNSGVPNAKTKWGQVGLERKG